jgi:hypothetical protein
VGKDEQQNYAQFLLLKRAEQFEINELRYYYTTEEHDHELSHYSSKKCFGCQN